MSLDSTLCGLDPDQPDYAPRAVDALLAAAHAAGATDVHLQPSAAGLELKFRVDGVLLPVATLPARVAGNVVARLKVLAGLLTYHSDRPQEGRIRLPVGQASDRAGVGQASSLSSVEMRVCTYPTLHGERAVVRLFGGDGHYQHLDDLGLPPDVRQPLRRLLGETSGAIIVSGPAGSGKTTTVYACLREIAGQPRGKGDSPHLCAAPEGPFRRAPTEGWSGTVPFSAGARSLVSIEDPIEVAVDGVAQSQVHAPSGLDLAAGLRFLMRQDPEVIMVGEIRDRPTAEAALQASLTGHLLLSTFHAGSAAETVGRLLDMGIEPYVLRSGLLAILNQRLLRRLCACACPSDTPEDRLGLPVEHAMLPRGCAACGGTGYRGRFLLVEMLALSRTELARAILSRADTAAIERLAVEGGMLNRWQRACLAVADGLTSPDEVRRVLGFSA
jgi:type II secretory ATPase GspE/PulE/Tfp pilus assembly ATPase PilB-like protein